MPELKFNFYDIEECGYYETDQDNPNFGQASDVFHELASWLKDGRSLESTCTFEIDRNTGSNYLRAFGYDVEHHRSTGDYLVTT